MQIAYYIAEDSPFWRIGNSKTPDILYMLPPNWTRVDDTAHWHETEKSFKMSVVLAIKGGVARILYRYSDGKNPWLMSSFEFSTKNVGRNRDADSISKGALSAPSKITPLSANLSADDRNQAGVACCIYIRLCTVGARRWWQARGRQRGRRGGARKVRTEAGFDHKIDQNQVALAKVARELKISHEILTYSPLPKAPWFIELSWHKMIR